MVFVHGFTEHALRYEEIVQTICARGYAVHAIDLRGHGRSEGARVWVRSFDDYVGDVERFVGHVRQTNPAKPVFLWGHSMGGTIAALLAIDRRAALQGLILSAPLLKIPDHLFPILRHLAMVISRIVPGLRAVGLGTRYMSRDPRVVEAFRADPLNFHGRFPVRTGAEIIRAIKKLWPRAEAIDVPLLILHGTGDVVTAPEGSRQLYARAESKDKTLQLYEGLYHDLLHEPEWETVLGDLLAWLDARVPAHASSATE